MIVKIICDDAFKFLFITLTVKFHLISSLCCVWIAVNELSYGYNSKCIIKGVKITVHSFANVQILIAHI